MEDLLSRILSALQGLVNWLLNALGGFFEFIGQAINGLIVFFGTVANELLRAVIWIVQFMIALWQPVLDFINSIIRVIVEIIQIIGLIISIAFTLFLKIGLWVIDAFTRLGQLIGDFFSATPIPIEGLPQCISDPLEHNLCSLWWLADNTVWAGEWGQLLVPIMILGIDLMILFIIIKAILRFMNRGETITDGH